MTLSQYLKKHSSVFNAPNRLYLSEDSEARKDAFNLSDYTVQSSLSGNQLFIVPNENGFCFFPIIVSDLQEGELFWLSPCSELTPLKLGKAKDGHFYGKYLSYKNFTDSCLSKSDIVFIHLEK